MPTPINTVQSFATGIVASPEASQGKLGSRLFKSCSSTVRRAARSAGNLVQRVTHSALSAPKLLRSGAAHDARAREGRTGFRIIRDETSPKCGGASPSAWSMAAGSRHDGSSRPGAALQRGPYDPPPLPPRPQSLERFGTASDWLPSPAAARPAPPSLPPKPRSPTPPPPPPKPQSPALPPHGPASVPMPAATVPPLVPPRVESAAQSPGTPLRILEEPRDTTLAPQKFDEPQYSTITRRQPEEPQYSTITRRQPEEPQYSTIARRKPEEPQYSTIARPRTVEPQYATLKPRTVETAALLTPLIRPPRTEDGA